MILKNQTVLITGGTGQLGHVVAGKFTQAGCRVASSYLFENELERLTPEFRKSVLTVRADVTKEEEVRTLFQKVQMEFGTVSILINIVGGFLPRKEVATTTVKEWEQMMNLNLHTTFLCSRQYLQQISGRPYGRIISMSAMPALKPSAGRAPYAVSKAGVVILTQVLGEELKGTGITANAIAPSIIRTEANIKSMPNEDSANWVSSEEIAETMIYLCSESAASINGLTIPMFGAV